MSYLVCPVPVGHELTGRRVEEVLHVTPHLRGGRPGALGLLATMDNEEGKWCESGKTLSLSPTISWPLSTQNVHIKPPHKFKLFNFSYWR